MRRSNYWVAAVLALVIATTAEAQIIPLYSTNFNGPTYTDGTLVPVTVATDTTTPGQDGWLSTNAGLTNPIQVSNTATNGIVTVGNTGQDVRHLFNGSATVTSGSVWLSADVNVSAANATGDYALHLSDGGTSNFYARVHFKSSGTGYVMGLSTSTVGTNTLNYGNTVLNFGTLYHVLARYDIVPGAANDTGALYIDPTTFDGSGDTPYVLATTLGTDATTIGAVALRQGTAANAPTLTVDNISVFTQPVPEPSSLALLGVAGVGLLARRLRRKAGC